MNPAERLMQFFTYKHLRSPELQELSRQCVALAQYMLDNCPDNDELTAGLRKLLEAKDCFLRAKLYKDNTS